MRRSQNSSPHFRASTFTSWITWPTRSSTASRRRCRPSCSKTSILERLEAGLCAAVVQAENPSGVKSILEYLEKSNLFLIQLDHERTWFRYHHLFADLLKARLEQSWPEQIPALHLRAAQWYEQKGAVEEAVAHALAANGWEQAAGLMEAHMMAYLEGGQLVHDLEMDRCAAPGNPAPPAQTVYRGCLGHGARQPDPASAGLDREEVETAMARMGSRKGSTGGQAYIAPRAGGAAHPWGDGGPARLQPDPGRPGRAGLALALATLENYPQADTP